MFSQHDDIIARGRDQAQARLHLSSVSTGQQENGEGRQVRFWQGTKQLGQV